MPLRRRKRRLSRIGDLSATRLGLPASRGRELRLLDVWQRTAGAALARRVTAVAVRRGVLEVEVEERRWFDALAPLLPELAARIVGACPELGIRKFRLRLQGASATGPPIEVQPLDADTALPERPIRRDDAANRKVDEPTFDLDRRLRAVRERYLERGGARRESND